MIVKSVRAIFRYEKISSPRSSVFRCCLALLLIAAGTAAAEAGEISKFRHEGLQMRYRWVVDGDGFEGGAEDEIPIVETVGSGCRGRFFRCRPLQPVSSGGCDGSFRRSAIGGQKRVVLRDCK